MKTLPQLESTSEGVINYVDILLMNAMSESQHKKDELVVPYKLAKLVETFIANHDIPMYFTDPQINNYQLYKAFWRLDEIGIVEWVAPETVMEFWNSSKNQYSSAANVEQFLTELTQRFTHSWANWPIEIPYTYDRTTGKCVIHWDSAVFPNI